MKESGFFMRNWCMYSTDLQWLKLLLKFQINCLILRVNPPPPQFEMQNLLDEDRFFLFLAHLSP